MAAQRAYSQRFTPDIKPMFRNRFRDIKAKIALLDWSVAWNPYCQ